MSKSRKPLHVCLGLCVFRSKKPSLVCPSLKTHRLCYVCLTKKTKFAIAYVLCTSTLCTSPRKQHQCHHRQLTLIVPLLCAFFQEDNINTTITNLRSLCLCYLYLSKKTLSTPPSSTLFKSPRQSIISYP